MPNFYFFCHFLTFIGLSFPCAMLDLQLCLYLGQCIGKLSQLLDFALELEALGTFLLDLENELREVRHAFTALDACGLVCPIFLVRQKAILGNRPRADWCLQGFVLRINTVFVSHEHLIQQVLLLLTQVVKNLVRVASALRGESMFGISVFNSPIKCLCYLIRLKLFRLRLYADEFGLGPPEDRGHLCHGQRLLLKCVHLRHCLGHS